MKKLLAMLRRFLTRLKAEPAEDMAARMESVRRDLNRRLDGGGDG